MFELCKVIVNQELKFTHDHTCSSMFCAFISDSELHYAGHWDKQYAGPSPIYDYDGGMPSTKVYCFWPHRPTVRDGFFVGWHMRIDSYPWDVDAPNTSSFILYLLTPTSETTFEVAYKSPEFNHVSVSANGPGGGGCLVVVNLYNMYKAVEKCTTNYM